MEVRHQDNVSPYDLSLEGGYLRCGGRHCRREGHRGQRFGASRTAAEI